MRGDGKAFEPGQSGNPAGRPKGAGNHTTRAIEALLDGDGPALRLCLDRLLPVRRDRPRLCQKSLLG
jgi:hypothetical protein